MTRHPTCRPPVWLLVLPLVLMGALAAGAAEARRVSEAVDADADGVVEIELISGSVEIEGWDQPRVEIEGTVERDVQRVRVERKGRRVEIEIVRKDAGGLEGLSQLWSDRLSVDLQVRVPAGGDVEVDAITADIVVEAVTGEIEADAISGDIRVVGGRRVDLETVSGDIEVEAGVAEVEAQSVSGDIEIRLQGGDVDAETVSGDVDLRIEAVDEGDAESVSGDIDFVGGLAAGGRLEAESHSGNIDVSIPAGARVSLELETHAGDIRNELSDRQEYRYEFETDVDGRRIRTESASDTEATLELSTFSGDIRIRAR